jgi:hypothetical protein
MQGTNCGNAPNGAMLPAEPACALLLEWLAEREISKDGESQ